MVTESVKNIEVSLLQRMCAMAVTKGKSLQLLVCKIEENTCKTIEFGTHSDL